MPHDLCRRSNDQITERVESDFMVVYQDQRAHLNRKLWFRLKGFFCKVFTNLGRILETLYILRYLTDSSLRQTVQL